MIDWQLVINIVAGAVLSVVGWFARVLWEADKEIRKDLAQLREKLPETYVSKDDYREDLRELKSMIERVLDRLDTKMDKHGQ